ncbi:MAG TPA: hypothetical protein PLL64_00605 [Rhodothermales bacterium]|nr:DUF3052 domain-containing protein [Bacteroidota bacterium]HRK72744.1 hypothetical protein [Rhodothermales bacterium]HRR08065.1 hypothetical protein [Rhodothermales bacterium]
MNPILKKLGYKGQPLVLLLEAPESFAAVIQEFETPPDVIPVGTYAFILAFAKDKRALNNLTAGITTLLKGDGHLWLAYPKKTSRMYKSDLSREVVGACLGSQDFEPVRQIAIDQDWSALRFRHVGNIKSMTRSFAATKEGQRRTQKPD